jgi:hypothetical protein
LLHAPCPPLSSLPEAGASRVLEHERQPLASRLERALSQEPAAREAVDSTVFEVEILTRDVPERLREFLSGAVDVVRERGEFGSNAAAASGSALWEAGEQIRAELGVASSGGGQPPARAPMSTGMQRDVTARYPA